MNFGAVPLDDAEGAVLAHSVALGAGRLRKGSVLSAEHIDQLRADGLSEVIVARLDAQDMDENSAALALAQALVPDVKAANLRLTEPFTGRVNVIAQAPGVVALDVAAIERFNRIDPMITIATLPPFQQVPAGGMVATIKIISYGVRTRDVERAGATAGASIRVRAPVMRSAGLVITEIASGPSNDKGIRSTRNRLEALGMELSEVRVVPHEAPALADALVALEGDLALILTGSATSDAADVAPAGLRLAGGELDHFGMPVDPGNLLFLGHLAGRTVIGLPGCARAPALNGADWVLSRIACGIAVTGADIAAMGVGGLLKEIPTRPQPRRPVKTR